MLALTLVRNALPTIMGSSSTWRMFAGMMARPAASSDRTFSTSTPSRSATNRISGVTRPWRASVSWVSPAGCSDNQGRRTGSLPSTAAGPAVSYRRKVSPVVSGISRCGTLSAPTSIRRDRPPFHVSYPSIVASTGAPR